LGNSQKNRFSVKQVCSTRWESYISAVKAIFYETNNTVNALIEVSDLLSTEADLRHEEQCLADNRHWNLDVFTGSGSGS
jgi:hypothetical protein